MAGHAQLKFVMTECSKTQIRLTGLIYLMQNLWARSSVGDSADGSVGQVSHPYKALGITTAL